MLTCRNFYDHVSGYYEKMIDYEKNLQLRIDAYKNIFPINGKVADIGCGTGLDSVALARNGHTVTAFDISPNMISELKKKAIKENLQIKAYVNSFKTISQKYNYTFDYVVSVGNTIAHLRQSELKKSFLRMHNLLKPGGKLFLHILNYEKIIMGSKRINNIAYRDGLTIIRFYDFLKSYLNFNILSFCDETPKEYSLVTTKHFPHSINTIKNCAKYGRFRKINFYSTFGLDKFNQNESKDIFILLKK